MNKKYTPSVNKRTARPRSPRLQAVGGSYTVIKNTGVGSETPTVTIDSTMSDSSGNPVQNKVIKKYIDDVRKYFEDKVPGQVLFDIASIVSHKGAINSQTRDNLYNLFSYQDGNAIPTEPIWVTDTNGRQYIVKMLDTETEPGFIIIGYEGYTRIEGNNTANNNLLDDKPDLEYVDSTYFSQAQIDPAKTHDYVKASAIWEEGAPKVLEIGIDLHIQDDIADAAEENDADLDNGVFHNGLVTALGVKRYVESKDGLTVDDQLSENSTNPVQNKVITTELNDHDKRLSDMESFFAEGAKLTLRILSNQSDDEVIAAVKATIAYDDEVIEAGAGTIGLPPFKVITVTFPDVEGYKTPEPLEFETGAVPVSYSVTYETEVARVILSAYDDANVIGSTVIINGTSYVWNGTIIEQKIPYGVTYKAEATTDLEEHIRPEETFTASQLTREIGLQYSAMVGSWIVIDQTITDPTTMISGDVNGEHIQLIRNNSHRYLGKYTAEGTMTICQLDDSDSNYYSDGTTAADLTGNEGDVFMRLPRFFYIASEKRTDVWKIGFYYGGEAPNSKWKEWDGKDLIGVYKAVAKDSKLYSHSDVGILGNSFTQSEWINLANSRGNGFSLQKLKHRNIMAFLFFAMYGNTDSRGIIGAGPTSIGGKNGVTNVLGMEDTRAADNGNNQSINFWGLEAFWGTVAERVGNVTIDGESWNITEDNGTIRQVPTLIINQAYFVSKILVGEYLDIVATAKGGSRSTGYCDGQYMSSGESVLIVSGFSQSSGVIYTSSFKSDYLDDWRSSRLVFRGNLIEETNPETFKSLTAIG